MNAKMEHTLENFVNICVLMHIILEKILNALEKINGITIYQNVVIKKIIITILYHFDIFKFALMAL